MSSQNDNSGAYVGFAFIGVCFWVAAVFLYALAAFFALVVTICSILAWDKPLKVGKLTLVEPHEARQFIGFGIIGAIALPSFAVFSSILFGFALNQDVWLHLLVGGYTGGCLFGPHLVEKIEAETNPVLLPPPAPIEHEQRLLPGREDKPFRFASWDDEEEFDGRS